MPMNLKERNRYVVNHGEDLTAVDFGDYAPLVGWRLRCCKRRLGSIRRALLGELDLANCKSWRLHQQVEGVVGRRSDPATVSIGCYVSDHSVQPRLMQR
ncbi:hypothetical protein BHE74_00015601 [Ensete ventricosum]|nr:hypothetical protein BHE74_00015601 [Ensete ventricosum]